MSIESVNWSHSPEGEEGRVQYKYIEFEEEQTTREGESSEAEEEGAVAEEEAPVPVEDFTSMRF